MTDGAAHTATESAAEDAAGLDLDGLEAVDNLASLPTVVGEDPAPVRTPKLEPYDPNKDREKLRARLAMWLLGILSFIVVAAVGLLSTERWAHLSTADLRTVLELMFTPVVTLLGAVAGFYYGANSDKKI